jgi:hypothetical protein
VNDLVRDIPAASGVYFFYGTKDLLLYVGKSKKLRSRVRAHFRDKTERRMMQRVRRVAYTRTAGELGALLLELRLIKELRPMYNVASKHKRRIILAHRKKTSDGYHAVDLKAVDFIDPKKNADILGVFKHRTQAKEFFGDISKTHRLCHKLLGIERARTYCFAYHLGRCDGACEGEEPPAAYNERLESAFNARRIKSWPYKGGVVVEESSDGLSEIFLVDNWCLLGTLCRENGTRQPFVPTLHRFDYDTYKILYSFIAHPSKTLSVTGVDKRRWNALLKKARASTTSPHS